MPGRILAHLHILLFVTGCCGVVFAAEPNFAEPFQDGMVVQRGAPLPVWGQATAGAQVTVTAGDLSAETMVNPGGAWRVELPSLKTAGPTDLLLRCSGREIRRQVLVGDVWVCAGQSNMDFPLRMLTQAEEEIPRANLPLLRLLTVPDRFSAAPEQSFAGKWVACEPRSAADFSAIGFLVGRALQEQEKIPIGLIRCSKGASPIEWWVNVPNTLRASQKIEHAGELYNGMLAPLTEFPVKGIIWYQGESNVDRAETYQALLERLIHDWRLAWRNEKLPFFIVQLANYGPVQSNAAEIESGWAKVRWAQALAVKNTTDTWLVSAVDLGEVAEIHPPNKRPLAQRVAAVVLRQIYRRDLPAAGPKLLSQRVEAGRVHLHFDLPLNSRGDVEKSFALTGADGQLLNPKVKLEDCDLTLWHEGIPSPASVHYAWANNPRCTLYSAEGWPVEPLEILLEK